MQPGVIAGVVARLTDYGLHLFLTTIMGDHASPDGASVGFDALQFHFNPALLRVNIIAQQRRRLVHIHDQDVHVAVVIEVSKSAPPAAVRGCDSCSGLCRQFFKGAVPEIAKQNSRCLVGILREFSLNLRINAPGHDEHVGVAIVIEIDDAGAPARVTDLHGNFRQARDVLKIALPIATIETKRIPDKWVLQRSRWPSRL